MEGRRVTVAACSLVAQVRLAAEEAGADKRGERVEVWAELKLEREAAA